MMAVDQVSLTCRNIEHVCTRECVGVSEIFGDYTPSISSTCTIAAASIHPSSWIFSQRSVCERQKSYLDGSAAHYRAGTHMHACTTHALSCLMFLSVGGG